MNASRLQFLTAIQETMTCIGVVIAIMSLIITVVGVVLWTISSTSQKTVFEEFKSKESGDE